MYDLRLQTNKYLCLFPFVRDSSQYFLSLRLSQVHIHSSILDCRLTMFYPLNVMNIHHYILQHFLYYRLLVLIANARYYPCQKKLRFFCNDPGYPFVDSSSIQYFSPVDFEQQRPSPVFSYQIDCIHFYRKHLQYTILDFRVFSKNHMIPRCLLS